MATLESMTARTVLCALMRRGWLVAFALLLVAAPARAETAMFLHVAPEQAPMRRPLIVGGQLTDNSGVERLVLFYRTGWVSWRQQTLQFDPPDTWVAAIPADDLTPPQSDFDHGFLEYYVVAFGSSGQRTFVYASPTAPRRVALKSTDPEPDEELPPAATPKPPSADDWADAVPGEVPRPRTKPSRDELAVLLPVPKLPVKAEDPVIIQPRPRDTVGFALGAERIRQLGLRTLIDALPLLPGLSVARDVQGFWHVTARGRASDAEVIVLLDGQRVSNPLDGKVDWEMPLTDVERIEAQFAPDLPTELGSAFAVVSITSTLRDGIGGGGFIHAFGKLDEFNNHSYGGHFLAGHTWGRLRLSGGADYAMRAGYLRTVAVDGIPREGVAGLTDDERYGGVARFRLEYAFEGGSTLHFQLRASHVQGSTLIGAVDVLEPESKLVGQTGLAEVGTHVALGSWSIDSRLFADEQRTDRDLALFPAGAFARPLSLPDGLFFRTAVGLTSTGLAVSASRIFGPLDTLRFGLDAQRQSVTEFAQSTTPDSETSAPYHLPGNARTPMQVPGWATRWLGALFVENVWRPLRILTLTAGARGELASGLGDPLFLPSGRLSLLLRVAPFMALRAGASRASRLPTFDELLAVVPLPANLNDGLPTGFNPNTPTKPTTLTAVELGVDSYVGPEENRVILRAGGFFNLYENPIDVIDAGQGYRFANRAKGEHYLGAEGEVRYDWKKLLSIFANISWMVGQDRALAETSPDFSFLTEAPALRANTGVVLPILNVMSLAGTLTYGSERHGTMRSVVEVQRAWQIPPYVLVSGTIRSAPIAGFLEIAASVYAVSLNGALTDPVPRPDRLPGLLPREGLNGSISIRAVY